MHGSIISPHLRAAHALLFCFMLSGACFLAAPHTLAQNLLADTPEQNKEWHTITDGFQIAAREKKPLIVDFYTDWCGWCKVMDKKTYGDNRVKSITEKSFILAKYNPEKDKEFLYQGKTVQPTEFARMMKVSGYPTTALFSADGKHLESLSGYIEPNKFLDILNYMIDKRYDGIGGRTLTEHLLLENIERDPNSPRYRLDLAEYYADSANYKKSLEIFSYVAGMRPNDPADIFALHNGWGAMQFFYAKDYKNAIDNFRKALANPAEPQVKAVTMLRLAIAEVQENQTKTAIESFQKFAKYCKENKLNTQGLRASLEKSAELERVRGNKDFQQVMKLLQ